MLDRFLAFTMTEMTFNEVFFRTIISLFLGLCIAGVYMFRNIYNKNFVITLALMPAIIHAIIMLVNGNIGTGVAVMGAFSLVRFRSVPGTSKEITGIILSMAAGLAVGAGFIGYSILFTVVICAMILLYTVLPIGDSKPSTRSLKVTVPEDLDYPTAFTDIFAEYCRKISLERVRTINLGSLYELHYIITLKDQNKEKDLLDKIRERNSNLNILCGRVSINREEL
jgi:hypothetical protein